VGVIGKLLFSRKHLPGVHDQSSHGSWAGFRQPSDVPVFKTSKEAEGWAKQHVAKNADYSRASAKDATTMNYVMADVLEHWQGSGGGGLLPIGDDLSGTTFGYKLNLIEFRPDALTSGAMPRAGIITIGGSAFMTKQYVTAELKFRKSFLKNNMRDEEDLAEMTPAERERHAAFIEDLKREVEEVQATYDSYKSGKHDHYELHSMYAFDNPIEAHVRHEAGHIWAYRNESKLQQRFGFGYSVERDAPLEERQREYDQRMKYGVTMRARDDWQECIAENFALYSAGKVEKLHPDMVQFFQENTKWRWEAKKPRKGVAARIFRKNAPGTHDQSTHGSWSDGGPDRAQAAYEEQMRSSGYQVFKTPEDAKQYFSKYTDLVFDDKEGKNLEQDDYLKLASIAKTLDDIYANVPGLSDRREMIALAYSKLTWQGSFFRSFKMKDTGEESNKFLIQIDGGKPQDTAQMLKDRIKNLEDSLSYMRRKTGPQYEQFQNILAMVKGDLESVTSGRYDSYREHSNQADPDNFKTTVLHEMGHCYHHAFQKEIVDMFGKRAAPKKGENVGQKFAQQYAVTARAGDNIKECIAENFTLYAIGKTERMHPDMVKLFDETTTFRNTWQKSVARRIFGKHYPGLHDQADHGNRFGGEGSERSQTHVGRARDRDQHIRGDNPRDAETQERISKETEKQLIPPAIEIVKRREFTVYERPETVARVMMDTGMFRNVEVLDKKPYSAAETHIPLDLKGASEEAAIIEEMAKQTGLRDFRVTITNDEMMDSFFDSNWNCINIGANDDGMGHEKLQLNIQQTRDKLEKDIWSVQNAMKYVRDESDIPRLEKMAAEYQTALDEMNRTLEAAKEGRTDYYKYHSMFAFESKREAVVRHEFGHAFYHNHLGEGGILRRLHKLNESDERYQKIVESAIMVNSQLTKLYVEKYAPTHRGRDNFSECFAECFALWSAGKTEAVHPDMVKVIEDLTKPTKAADFVREHKDDPLFWQAVVKGYDAVDRYVQKHYPGLHDQADHGNRFGSEGEQTHVGRARDRDQQVRGKNPRDAETQERIAKETEKQLTPPAAPKAAVRNPKDYGIKEFDKYKDVPKGDTPGRYNTLVAQQADLNSWAKQNINENVKIHNYTSNVLEQELLNDTLGVIAELQANTGVNLGSIQFTDKSVSDGMANADVITLGTAASNTEEYYDRVIKSHEYDIKYNKEMLDDVLKEKEKIRESGMFESEFLNQRAQKLADGIALREQVVDMYKEQLEKFRAGETDMYSVHSSFAFKSEAESTARHEFGHVFGFKYDKPLFDRLKYLISEETAEREGGMVIGVDSTEMLMVKTRDAIAKLFSPTERGKDNWQEFCAETFTLYSAGITENMHPEIVKFYEENTKWKWNNNKGVARRIFRKHYPGVHDQSDHGNRYGSDGNQTHVGRARDRDQQVRGKNPRDAETQSRIEKETEAQLKEPKTSKSKIPYASPNSRKERVMEALKAKLQSMVNRIAFRSGKQVTPEEIKAELDDHMKEMIGQCKPLMQRTPATVLKILDEGRFQNQFESGKSGGMFYPTKRQVFEEKVFGYPSDVEGKDRMKYGLLANPDTDDFRRRAAGNYGCVTIQFNDDVLDRTTYTLNDSLDTNGVDASNYASYPVPAKEPEFVCADYDSANIMETVYSSSTSDRLYKVVDYVEAQYHGDLTTKDIARIIIYQRDIDSYKRHADMGSSSSQLYYDSLNMIRVKAEKMGIPVEVRADYKPL
jgi:hypothetical protein